MTQRALDLGTQPDGAVSGRPLLTQPVVRVELPDGTLASGDDTTLVTVSVAVGGARVSGTTTMKAVSGVATFTDLTLTGAAGEHRLGFSAHAAEPVVSGLFTVREPGQGRPTVVITSPETGTVFTAGMEAPFAGSANDPEDGLLSGEALLWISSLNGPLGSGSSLTRNDLVPGSHVIQLVATDSDGHLGADTVDIEVVPPQPGNQPPVASIVLPPEGASFVAGASVSFEGRAEDPEDGTLPGSALAWSSNQDGPIGSGSSIVVDDLSVASHLVHLVATDSDGLVDTASVTVTITQQPPPPQRPTVAISAPQDGTEFLEGEAITFRGAAADAEDGVLSGASLVWLSSLDGQIGTDTLLVRSDLTTGSHVVRLIATDSDGLADTASVAIAIVEPPPLQPPAATLTSPVDGSIFDRGASVLFAGSAIDPEDGVLAGRFLLWTSSLDGSLGSGTALIRDNLASGDHLIELVATDSDGLADTARVSITVLDPPPPPPPDQGICEASEGATCWYAAPDGDDVNPGTFEAPVRTPQTAIRGARPGDYIYLRGGTYDLSHGVFVDFRNPILGDLFGIGIGGPIHDDVLSGEEGSPITLKGYPGEEAILADGFSIQLSERAYWRFEDLTLRGGGNFAIGGSDAHDIYVVGNDVGGHTQLGGNNPGIIRINGGTTAPAYNIFIEDNFLHDFVYHACSAGDTGCNDPSTSGLTWDQVRDVFHVGAVTTVTCADPNATCMTGLIAIRNNQMFNVPSALFFKRPFTGPVVVEGNTIHNVQALGHWRASNVTFQHNLIYNVVMGPGVPVPGTGAFTSFDIGPPEPSGQNLMILRNTFVGMNQVVRFGSYGTGHTIRDNVVFGLDLTTEGGAYVANRTTDDIGANDFDANCFITTFDFIAVDDNGVNYTLAEARATFDLEGTSTVIEEDDQMAVFANPAAQDYSLIGVAAQQCSGKGAF